MSDLKNDPYPTYQDQLKEAEFRRRWAHVGTYGNIASVPHNTATIIVGGVEVTILVRPIVPSTQAQVVDVTPIVGNDPGDENDTKGEIEDDDSFWARAQEEHRRDMMKAQYSALSTMKPGETKRVYFAQDGTEIPPREEISEATKEANRKHLAKLKEEINDVK